MANQDQHRRAPQRDENATEKEDANENEQLPELSERGGLERSAQPERTTESGEFANPPHDRTRDRDLNRRQGGLQDVEEGA